MSMSPRRAEPVSGSCSVAMVRMSVVLPEPLGPMIACTPLGMVSETLFSAVTPFEYVFEMFSMRSSMCGSLSDVDIPGKRAGRRRRGGALPTPSRRAPMRHHYLF